MLREDFPVAVSKRDHLDNAASRSPVELWSDCIECPESIRHKDETHSSRRTGLPAFDKDRLPAMGSRPKRGRDRTACNTSANDHGTHDALLVSCRANNVWPPTPMHSVGYAAISLESVEMCKHSTEMS